MKIAIMTVPFNNNYGGFLQAYALKTVLNEMGHSTIFIMRRRNRPNRLKNLLRWLLQKEKNIYLKDDIHLWWVSRYTHLFQNKYLRPFTRNYYNSNRLYECRNLDVDYYIVGSDQCWRYQFAPSNIDDFFFRFLKGSEKRRMSYAASFGTSHLEYDDCMLQQCKTLLEEFHAISVREASGIDLLEQYFNTPPGKAQITLDPTLLLNADAYTRLFKNTKKEYDNYIFSYILDDNDEKKELLTNVAYKLNVPTISQKAQVGPIKDLGTIEPVELWLFRIYHASFVVTDSFHGCAFSILFNKPFVVYGNPNRGQTRLDHLLATFCLNTRHVDSADAINNINLLNINWTETNNILAKLREESISFLKNALVN